MVTHTKAEGEEVFILTGMMSAYVSSNDSITFTAHTHTHTHSNWNQYMHMCKTRGRMHKNEKHFTLYIIIIIIIIHNYASIKEKDTLMTYRHTDTTSEFTFTCLLAGVSEG